jgi:hypothetical protein
MSIGGFRDMGTHGSRPTRVPKVPVKWTRPVEAPPTYKWAQRPYPQIRRLWKTSDNLIQIPEDLPGLWRKLLPRSRRGTANRSEDREILFVITEGDLPNV